MNLNPAEAPQPELSGAALVAPFADELRAFRRDLHLHPELSRSEFRTTEAIRARLVAAGLHPRVLPVGTGVVCDIPGTDGAAGGLLALRADIDALPVQDEKDVPYRSAVPGQCHACGHDVHTTVLLGAALVLAELSRAGRLRTGVRLVFQPAEEVMPGGALDVIAAGELAGVSRIFGVHCDPRLDVGRLGLREGPITSACDRLAITLTGPGGHTARPHLTADLVHALATMAVELPAALSRRIDPRAGVSLVWGRIDAGAAANVIPHTGQLEGTVRCLQVEGWRTAPDVICELVDTIAAPFGVKTEVTHQRGVPPVVNEPQSVAALRAAAVAALGADAVTTTEQSLGGEDFGWYLEQVPGAFARLGVRGPSEKAVRDIHQGTFDVDEEAIPVGVRVLVAAALRHGTDPSAPLR